MNFKMCCDIALTSITFKMSNDTHIVVPIPLIYIKCVITDSYYVAMVIVVNKQ
jgi:hypothetical protein